MHTKEHNISRNCDHSQIVCFCSFVSVSFKDYIYLFQWQNVGGGEIFHPLAYFLNLS